MADIKFTGVTFDYNNITIQIASDVLGVSQIGISGVTIGSAADYDRMKGLLPTLCKIKDSVNEQDMIGNLSPSGNTLVLSGATKRYTVTKSGSVTKCIVANRG